MTNWFDPDRPSVRTMLVAVMLLSLVMASVLPEAYHHDGLWFAAAYVAVQVGRTAAVVLLLRGAHRLRRNFVRILVWRSVSGVFWLLGAFLPAGARIVCWGVAVVINLTAAAVGFYLPTLGSANTDQWRISGGHLAERCQLFVMIALGESILVIGADFGGLRIRPLNALALAVAFFATVAFWWIYFDRTADAASEAISNSGDPGRLGRSAFTYYHVPMVAGIIVTAAGDELMISDPEYAPGVRWWRPSTVARRCSSSGTACSSGGSSGGTEAAASPVRRSCSSWCRSGCGCRRWAPTFWPWRSLSA